MFERFSQRARQAVVFAQDEARALGHGYIGTEHLLLGLLREDEGAAARALTSLGVTIETARVQVVVIAGRGDDVRTTGQIPFTARAKRALEFSLREALALGHGFIDTDDVLLGVVRDEESSAMRVLTALGLTAEQVRRGALDVLGSREYVRAEQPLRPAADPIRLTPSIRRLLELAHEEARALDHNRTRSEHILLALMRLERSVAARALASFGVTFENVRAEVVRLEESGRRSPGGDDIE